VIGRQVAVGSWRQIQPNVVAVLRGEKYGAQNWIWKKAGLPWYHVSRVWFVPTSFQCFDDGLDRFLQLPLLPADHLTGPTSCCTPSSTIEALCKSLLVMGCFQCTIMEAHGDVICHPPQKRVMVLTIAKMAQPDRPFYAVEILAGGVVGIRGTKVYNDTLAIVQQVS
jgi:hypothetical protein